MPKQKEFEILVTSLKLAHHHFSLNEIIHEEVGGEQYKNSEFLWNVIQLGLEQSYLLGLAKFFERSKDQDDTISVYYFSNFDFGHNEIFEKLKRIRNKMISHHDRKVIESSFLEELKLSKADVRFLFKLATETVERLKAESGYIHQDHVITGWEVDRLMLRISLKKWLEKLV